MNHKGLHSQKQKILAYLQSGKGITPLQALDLCGCMRLSERIRNLESDGYLISHIPYRTHTGKRVMSYRLENGHVD